jgi:hypothetical protein
MDEGWHVAGMILTLQVAEKMRLELRQWPMPRKPDHRAILHSNLDIHGNGHSIRPGPLWGIRS